MTDTYRENIAQIKADLEYIKRAIDRLSWMIPLIVFAGISVIAIIEAAK